MSIDAGRIREIEEWLVEEMLADARLKTVVPELARRLATLGVPVHRCRLTWPTLHPLFEAETLLWTAEFGVTSQRFDRERVDDTAWRQSTVKWMLDNGSNLLRARLDGRTPEPTFPLYDEMRAESYVDFIALRTQLFADDSLLRQENSDRDFGLYVAWATKDPAGFSAEAAELLEPCRTLDRLRHRP